MGPPTWREGDDDERDLQMEWLLVPNPRRPSCRRSYVRRGRLSHHRGVLPRGPRRWRHRVPHHGARHRPYSVARRRRWRRRLTSSRRFRLLRSQRMRCVTYSGSLARYVYALRARCYSGTVATVRTQFRSDGGWRLHTPIPITLPRSRMTKPMFHVDDICDQAAPNRHLPRYVGLCVSPSLYLRIVIIIYALFSHAL